MCPQTSQIVTLSVKFKKDILGVQNFCIFIGTSQGLIKYEHLFYVI